MELAAQRFFFANFPTLVGEVLTRVFLAAFLRRASDFPAWRRGNGDLGNRISKMRRTAVARVKTGVEWRTRRMRIVFSSQCERRLDRSVAIMNNEPKEISLPQITTFVVD